MRTFRSNMAKKSVKTYAGNFGNLTMSHRFFYKVEHDVFIFYLFLQKYSPAKSPPNPRDHYPPTLGIITSDPRDYPATLKILRDPSLYIHNYWYLYRVLPNCGKLLKLLILIFLKFLRNLRNSPGLIRQIKNYHLAIDCFLLGYLVYYFVWSQHEEYSTPSLDLILSLVSSLTLVVKLSSWNLANRSNRSHIM